jgi:hypothetical protein
MLAVGDDHAEDSVAGAKHDCQSLPAANSVTELITASTVTTSTAENMRQWQPNSSSNSSAVASDLSSMVKFNLTNALFCAGLAFDAYVEPPPNSSRWEKGSQGLNVAFCSPAFTRSLYKGLVEITPIRCIGLPEEVEGGGGAEALVTGKGVDAAILVAVIEGRWKQDVELLESEYHQGVLDLTGAAHVGRSSTAWSNVDQRISEGMKHRYGKASPYHIPAGWGKGGRAVWPEPEPFYLYLQDPSTARLVISILDDNKIGQGSIVGSAHRRLADLIPQARLSPENAVAELKREVLRDLNADTGKENNINLLATTMDQLNETSKIRLGAKTWTGTLRMTSKPRKKDKNSQILAGAAAGAYVAGPVGAAVGGLLGTLYEGRVDGYVDLTIRYLPIPKQVVAPRKKYTVLGGMPGITWGRLFEKHLEGVGRSPATSPLDDLEHCFFVNHDSTGATCAVYRSLEKRLIVISFRGTCRPVDLLTDVSIVQESWVEGDEFTDGVPKVHAGFRGSHEGSRSCS